MKQSFRVILFNNDERYAAALRSDLLGIQGVQIVAEVDELALVEQAVAQFPAEILVVHLDPVPEAVLPAAAQIARGNPDLAVLVVSESTDAQHVLTAMRAGIREFLNKPVDPELLKEAVGKLVARSGSNEVGTLISVMGTVGGAGASTIAINLAVELAQLVEKRPVALVDLDFRFGQLGTMLDLQADYTIADLSDTPEQLDSAMIEKAMVKHCSGVHVLARPNQFSQANHITAAHCASVLSTLQQMYEYVVVDGPNRFDTGGMAVLDLADVNLLVVQLLVPSVRNVHRMLDELRSGGYNLSRFRLVCNRVSRESAYLEVGHVEKTLNMKVEYQIPDDWKTVIGSVNVGVPLLDCAPKSSVRGAFRQMAQKIFSPQEAAVESTRSGGLLGRIFSGV